MGMTMTEKILARASGTEKVSPGDIVVVDVHTSVLIDNTFLPAMWREMLKPLGALALSLAKMPVGDRKRAPHSMPMS